MMVACILLAALAAGAAVAFLVGRSSGKRGSEERIPSPPRPVLEGCCGRHEVCEKESLLAAAGGEAEYYDDEELDRFRGKDASAYSETEADEFRDILYTMRGDEVAGWVRSLQLRGILLPDALKDEVFLIVGERRAGRT